MLPADSVVPLPPGLGPVAGGGRRGRWPLLL
jgi:hypothetical protein